MRLGLLIPLLLLIGLAGGWLITLLVVRQRKQLTSRLEAVVPTGRPVQPIPVHGTSIRVRQQKTSKLARAARLLKVPVELPLANKISPFWVFVLGIGAACGGFWLAHMLLSWTPSVIVALVTGILMIRGIFGWEIGKYQAQLVRQLPDTVQLVVSATRAGLPVSEAFRAIAQEMPSPTRDEFVRVDREMAMGSSPDEALLSLHKRTGVTEYAIFAVTIGVQARSGGRLAETIQNLAETVRERLAIGARAKALAGEAKISALIMAVLPLLAGGIMSITQPKQLLILFTDPRGIRMFVIAITTLILGVLTMQMLIRGATRD
jgi:tight adherence protein B